MAGLRKILLVDDDPAMLRLLAKWLEAEGYHVLRAGAGRMAAGRGSVVAPASGSPS